MVQCGLGHRNNGQLPDFSGGQYVHVNVLEHVAFPTRCTVRYHLRTAHRRTASARSSVTRHRTHAKIVTIHVSFERAVANTSLPFLTMDVSTNCR